MGASGWDYFVPYQPDIQAALAALRYQTFESGHYWKRGTKQELIDQIRDELVRVEHNPDPDYREQARSWLQHDLKKFQDLAEPHTLDEKIAELFILNAEDGTGSILDIGRISDTPEYGTVVPLSESQLIDWLGTTQPSHEIILAHREALMDLRERSIGTYVIVYKDKQPDEIYFCGFSGD